MTNPPQMQTFLPKEEKINHEEWNRAFRLWQRRCALPDELAELERRDRADAARQARANKGRGGK